MEKLNFNETFIDFTVRSMVNPENKDFYINNLSIAQVEDLLTGADDGLVDCFWQAFSRAFPQIITHKQVVKTANLVINEYNICPECGCKDYVLGIACPNCDHISD